jgi:MOSC domain-containing protein YiiM
MPELPIPATVVSVSRSAVHGFSKDPVAQIQILANHGVEGDAHAGPLVQHLYRVRKDPTALNLCQVHLLQAELFDELRAHGFDLAPGQIGENITTLGLNLLTLPVGTLVSIGPQAILEITGLRDPCNQLNKLQPGLMKACFTRSPQGEVLRKTGVMAIARTSGPIRPGDQITLQLPPKPWTKMTPV